MRKEKEAAEDRGEMRARLLGGEGHAGPRGGMEKGKREPSETDSACPTVVVENQICLPFRSASAVCANRVFAFQHRQG